MVTVFPPSATVTAISFFFVSVVMMALAELVTLSRLPSSVPDITWPPATILWIGICIPMTPVEATKTALAGIFRMSAAASAVALQYPYPSAPVQALACLLYTSEKTVAKAVKAEKLAFLTDVEGLYRDFEDKNSLVSEMMVDEAQEFINSGSLGGGMLPKLQNCVDAIKEAFFPWKKPGRSVCDGK